MPRLAATAIRHACYDDYASPGDAGTRRKHLGPWSVLPANLTFCFTAPITIAF
jgi:hypothetical protein